MLHQRPTSFPSKCGWYGYYARGMFYYLYLGSIRWTYGKWIFPRSLAWILVYGYWGHGRHERVLWQLVYLPVRLVDFGMTMATSVTRNMTSKVTRFTKATICIRGGPCQIPGGLNCLAVSSSFHSHNLIIGVCGNERNVLLSASSLRRLR